MELSGLAGHMLPATDDAVGAACGQRADVLKLALAISRELPRHCYLWQPTYASIVWEHMKLRHCTDEAIHFNKPVGLVLSGVLEVTEQFLSTSFRIPRRRTTAVIKPGQFFGLFESYAELYGRWRITAGVTRILISNRLGDQKLLEKLGLNLSRVQRTLRFLKDADFEYGELLDRARETSASPWTCALLMFDASEIESGQIEAMLHEGTIRQLASLVRQNPTETFVADAEKADSHGNLRTAQALQTLAQFDAIVGGHVPILRLASSNDESMLPYRALVSLLGFDRTDVHTCSPHIFVPDYATADSTMIYVHALSQKVDMHVFASLIKYLFDEKVVAPTGLRVLEHRQTTKGNKPGFRALVETGRNQVALERTIGKKFQLPAPLCEQLYPDLPAGYFTLPPAQRKRHELAETVYAWSDHLAEMLALFPAARYH